MDKAQAYAVLRIEPGCTEEEIKKAYARCPDNIIQMKIRKNFNRFQDAIECCADRNNGAYNTPGYCYRNKRSRFTISGY